MRAKSWDAFPYDDFLTTGASSDGKYFGGGVELEDPSNGYVDTTRGAHHVLFHQGVPDAQSGEAPVGCDHKAEGGVPASNSSCGYGGAAHSINGTEWVYATKYWRGLGWSSGSQSAVSYTYEVEMDDGSVINCIRREEPKMLIEEGEPSALITQCSVAPIGHTAPPYLLRGIWESHNLHLIWV